MQTRKHKTDSRHRKAIEGSHAVARAKERYGVDLSSGDILGMIEKIRRGDCKKLPATHHEPHKESIEVAWGGKSYRIVYDKVSRKIVTMMPVTSQAKLLDIMPKELKRHSTALQSGNR